MSELVHYELREGVALLGWDDGKANVVSPASLEALNAALDRAEKEAQAVVLTGRPGRFSAGFDLKVMQGGDQAAMVAMVRGGAALGVRLYSFPLPVVAAVSGHALAMGAVILMSVDERIGVDADVKIGLNETAIGMTLPTFALILARERIARTHLGRATADAELYPPNEAVAAGFLDRVVAPEKLADAAFARAKELAELDGPAHRATKLALRERALDELRKSLEGSGSGS